MAEIDYSAMNGLEVLWHLISSFDKGFYFIITVGCIAFIASLLSDKYIADETTKHHDHHDLYR